MENASHPTVQPKSIVFWCCKSLGRKTLEYVLSLPEYGQTFCFKAIVISRKDTEAQMIQNLANQNKVNIFHEEDILSELYDMGLCIGFPKKIAATTLSLCKEGVINLHFAPLPAYRGSGTLTHAIINQEKEYGVTLHLMDEKLDTGPIILVKTIPLSKEKSALEIIPDIERLGYEVMVDNFMRLVTKSYKLIDQDDLISKTGVIPKFCTKKSVEKLYKLDFSWKFDKVHRYLRALTLGKPKKPFFEKGKKRIYLSLSEN